MDDREAQGLADDYLKGIGYAPLGMRCYGMGCYASPDGRTVVVACVSNAPTSASAWPSLSVPPKAIQRSLWAMAMLAEDASVMSRFDVIRADVIVVSGIAEAPRVRHGVGMASCVTDTTAIDGAACDMAPRPKGPRHMRVPEV